MIDLILWAANKADMRQFAENRGLRIPNADGVMQDRPGFRWAWWGSDGQFRTKLPELKASAAVDLVQLGEFAFQAKPAWMVPGVWAQRGDEIVGYYDRAQGPYSVFTEEPGAAVQLGETLDAWLPEEYLGGVVALVRLAFEVEDEDRLVPDPDDPEAAQPYKRSKVAKAIKDNGTPISVAGGAINGFEWDGVRLFLADDVETWRVANGLPGHVWL